MGRRGRRNERGVPGRLLRLIWALYPERWRARFGRELEQWLRQHHTSRPWSAVADALLTLPRSWIAERAHRRGTRTRGGFAGDLRNAWRAVTRAPGHAALAVLILALAVGANAAVFSVSWTVLLRTLPYHEPERVVRVEPVAVTMTGAGEWAPEPGFVSLPAVEGAALYFPDAGANLVEEDGATRLSVTQVDAAFFPTLGVDAAVGRLIGASEPSSPEAVLSWSLWIDAFGGDADVVGRSVDLSGHRVTVVGVAPPDVDFPVGTQVWASTPLVMDFFGTAFGPSMIARVRSVEAIPALTAAARAALEQRWGDAPDHLTRPEVAMTPLRDELVGPVRGPLLALSGAAAAILLLGCLNLAGIEVARTFRRSGELGVRRALGADRMRIFRQLVLEVAVRAAGAGAVAFGVAWLAGRILLSWLPPGVAGLDHARLGPPLLLATAVGTVLAALATGLVPAVRGARAAATGTGTTRRHTGDRERARIQGMLVVGQVVLAVVLSVGAGLLARSLAEMQAVPLGYDTRSVLTFRVRLPSHAYPDGTNQRQYVDRVVQQIERLPGVERVGVSTRLPLGSGMGTGTGLRAGDTPAEGERLSVSWLEVSEDFFGAMGIRLIAGSPPLPPAVPGQDIGGVVIDRATALRLFGEPTPLGREVTMVGRRDFPGTVVGVAEEVRLGGRGADPGPILYTSADSSWMASTSFAVRTAGDPSAMVPSIRAAMAEVDPGVPPFEVRTTGQAVADEMAARRAVAVLSSLFRAAALALVALGLYGMVAQAVSARRRELGIRLALGAAAGRMIGGTVVRSLALVLGGAAAGLLLALAAGRLLRSLLFNVAPTDPGVLTGVMVTILIVGALAAFVPASRVGRIDPSEALRSE